MAQQISSFLSKNCRRFHTAPTLTTHHTLTLNNFVATINRPRHNTFAAAAVTFTKSMLTTTDITGRANVASVAKATSLANGDVAPYRITIHRQVVTTQMQVTYRFHAADFTSFFVTQLITLSESS